MVRLDLSLAKYRFILTDFLFKSGYADVMMLQRIFVILSVFFLSASSSFGQDCKTAQEDLVHQISAYEAQLDAIQSLQGKGESFEIPYLMLFPRDSEAGAQELVSETQLETYQKCFLSTEGVASKEYATFLSLRKKTEAARNEFLELDTEKKEVLITAYRSHFVQPEDQLGSEKQLTQTQNALKSAQNMLEKSEKKVEETTGSQIDRTLELKTAVERYRVGLEKEQIEFIRSLRAKETSLSSLKAELAKQYQNYSLIEHSEDPRELAASVEKVTEVWGSAVDGIFELFSSVKFESQLEIPSEALSSDQVLVQKEVQQARQRQVELAMARTQLLNSLKIQDFRILQESGALRAKLIHACDSVNCPRPRGLTEKNITSVLREIKVVPLRLFAGGLSKAIEVRSKITSGLDGRIDLVSQGFILLVLLTIPFLMIHALRWTSARLNQIREKLLALSTMDYRKRTRIAVWISRMTPFIPSIGMILGIELARNLLSGTDLRDLAGVLYYVQIYFVYVTARLLLMISLEMVFSSHSVDSLKNQKSRIAKTATRISRLIFIEYILLHITEDAVRRALAYQLFSGLIFWVNIGFVFYVAHHWKKEVIGALKDRFPRFAPRIDQAGGSLIGELFLPLGFAWVIVYDVLRIISRYLMRLDFVKRLLSEVFRKRLERAEKDEKEFGPVPQPYLKAFDYYLPAQGEIFIDREDSVARRVFQKIMAWKDGKERNDLVLIVGNRGMGKTTTLNRIASSLKEDASGSQVSVHAVPARTLSAEALFSWLSEVLDQSIKSVSDVQEFDQSLKSKKAFCIDDIQNLFLSSIGGFEAYRLFLEVVSLNTERLHWCLTANSRSWSYLQGVFGVEHFYGQVIALPSWKDFEIQKLILVRHNSTGLSRSFDESIKAYGAGEGLGQQVEAQFFRLLWGQSRGNPRAALMYWVSAISSPSQKRIHVGIPSFIPASQVGSMSDDALFLLSAIAKHESLTQAEMKAVTGIQEAVIRKCILEAQDKELVWVDSESRVKISSRAQYVVDYFLIGKNFLYE